MFPKKRSTMVTPSLSSLSRGVSNKRQPSILSKYTTLSSESPKKSADPLESALKKLPKSNDHRIIFPWCQKSNMFDFSSLDHQEHIQQKLQGSEWGDLKTQLKSNKWVKVKKNYCTACFLFSLVLMPIFTLIYVMILIHAKGLFLIAFFPITLVIVFSGLFVTLLQVGKKLYTRGLKKREKEIKGILKKFALYFKTRGLSCKLGTCGGWLVVGMRSHHFNFQNSKSKLGMWGSSQKKTKNKVVSTQIKRKMKAKNFNTLHVAKSSFRKLRSNNGIVIEPKTIHNFTKSPNLKSEYHPQNIGRAHHISSTKLKPYNPQQMTGGLENMANLLSIQEVEVPTKKQ